MKNSRGKEFCAWTKDAQESIVVERGVWWRINYTLKALAREAAPTRDEHMALADLTSYASLRAFAPPT